MREMARKQKCWARMWNVQQDRNVPKISVLHPPKKYKSSQFRLPYGMCKLPMTYVFYFLFVFVLRVSNRMWFVYIEIKYLQLLTIIININLYKVYILLLWYVICNLQLTKGSLNYELYILNGDPVAIPLLRISSNNTCTWMKCNSCSASTNLSDRDLECFNFIKGIRLSSSLLFYRRILVIFKNLIQNQTYFCV